MARAAVAGVIISVAGSDAIVPGSGAAGTVTAITSRCCMEDVFRQVSETGVACNNIGEGLPIKNLSLGGFFVATDRPLIQKITDQDYDAGTFTLSFGSNELMAGMYFVKSTVSNAKGEFSKTIKTVVVH